MTTTKIRHPAFRYFGGKWRLAKWIIPYFPLHWHYIEPLGGAASVLLQKPPSHTETYNDLDGRVVNFFQILRDRPEDLIRAIELTPYARSEYELSRNGQQIDDPIERARRFWIGCSFSITTLPETTSGFRISTTRQSRTSAPRVAAKTEHLYTVAARLKLVQIENLPYQKLLPRYDAPGNLFYMDPPYVTSTRTHKKRYRHDWADEQHTELAELLHSLQGYVVLSGSPSPLYESLFPNWPRFDRLAQTQRGSRTESLYLSPTTHEALQSERNRTQQLEMFQETGP